MSAFIHGKGTVFKLDSTDISAYCKTSEVTDGADEHDVTGYGADGHGYQGGLRAAKVTVSGTYYSGTDRTAWRDPAAARHERGVDSPA